MLAGDAHALLFAVEGVQRVQVLEQDRPHLGGGRRGQQFAGGQVVGDLAEDPRPALGGAADHHRVGAGVAQHLGGALR